MLIYDQGACKHDRDPEHGSRAPVLGQPCRSSVSRTTPSRAWLFTAGAFGPGEAPSECAVFQVLFG